MRNYLFFLCIILALLIVFILNIHTSLQLVNTTFYSISPFTEKLTVQLVNNYFSQEESVHKNAEKKIKEIVLRDLDYGNWLEYLDYIEITIYPSDIINGIKEDLILTVNISKDKGVIAIYNIYNDTYVFVTKIEDLAYINSISTIKRDYIDTTYIIVEEILDEKLGSYFSDHYVRLYAKIGSNFIEVFRQSLDYEAYYYEKWENPSLENPKWFKITEKNLIDYVINADKTIVININKILFKYESIGIENGSIPNDFKLVEEKILDLQYFWSNEYNYFIQGKGKIKSAGVTVGIIDNSLQFADSYLGLVKPYYKVIHKNGKIEYISENNLVITEDEL